MTTRMMYQPTPKQLAKWPAPGSRNDLDSLMPPDDEIKAMWAKSHGGKTSGWGMKKRDLKLSLMTASYEYQLGIWQGRVDAARGLPYSEERNENTYNLGYHRGYTEYESNRRGWDAGTRAQFDEQYLSDLKEEYHEQPAAA